MTVYIIISSIVALLIGGLLTWLSMRFLLKSRYDSVLREAEKEAEVIKKNKLLEVKEKFLHLHHLRHHSEEKEPPHADDLGQIMLL